MMPDLHRFEEITELPECYVYRMRCKRMAVIFKEGLQNVCSLAAEIRAKQCNQLMLDFKSLPLSYRKN